MVVSLIRLNTLTCVKRLARRDLARCAEGPRITPTKVVQRLDRTPENPPGGLCQGPDKNLTSGVDVCADPDNFRVQNWRMYVSRSGQFWTSHGGLCQGPDNFGRGRPRSGVWRRPSGPPLMSRTTSPGTVAEDNYCLERLMTILAGIYAIIKRP
jgi:hypothetical protein